MEFRFRCICICGNDTFYVDSDTKAEAVNLRCSCCDKVVAKLSFYDFKLGVNRINGEQDSITD